MNHSENSLALGLIIGSLFGSLIALGINDFTESDYGYLVSIIAGICALVYMYKIDN